MELTEQLKQHVASIYRKKYGDNPALTQLKIDGKTYTGNEIANEIENETDFGVEQLKKLLNLTIDLIQRQKI